MFKTMFVAALAAFSLSAQAELVATSTDGEISIGLTAEACKNEIVLKIIPPQFHARAFKARTLVRGQPMDACFVLMEENIIMVWEDGDVVPIPFGAFVEKEGV